jgi:hypothetical protein
VGLIVKPEFIEQDLFMSILTSYLLRGILERFDCRVISTQRELETRFDEVDVLLSLEPKFAAPLLNWRGGFLGWGRREPKFSYVMCSDSHMRKWRQGYFLRNRISFMLAQYHAPFRYNFRRIPEQRLVHFPWAVPDAMFHDGPIVCRNQKTLCCFGAAKGDAYNVRNWCKNFGFVKSFAFSGVENKALSNDSYSQWLSGFDAVVAAGSNLPQFDLTTPKYFEIAAAGALLFAQRTNDLERLGFRHMENCVVFDMDTFEAEAERYLRNPEDYLGIREAGCRLVRQRHSLSVRLDFLEGHMRGHLARRKLAA